MQKKVARKAEPAYWCTCATDPTKCIGCAIERLVHQVMGNIGTRHLENRIFKSRQPGEDRGKDRNK